jgi:maltooligosyltrehalose trehalohydrolase
MELQTRRRLPIGAVLVAAPGEAHFRVWAPKADRIDVAIEVSTDPNAQREFYPLVPEPGGYFAGAAPAQAGTFYRFRVNGSDNLHPDPASRSQPGGPHRSSCVVDSSAYDWSDGGWPGVSLPGQIIYEMHLGTFTQEGTWTAAARQLPELAQDGITLIEMMPIADFAGEFGWGYDGVDLFAPCRLYGTPDDLRAFIDTAHSLGMGVILDVVYNISGRTEIIFRFTPTTISTLARKRSGVIRSISTAQTAARSASFSSAMRATGSTSFISTASASTLPKASSTSPMITFCVRSAKRRGPQPANARLS